MCNAHGLFQSLFLRSPYQGWLNQGPHGKYNLILLHLAKKLIYHMYRFFVKADP